ncbi:helix-turn-helix domain-containing protein [Kitasatospora sp. P5_F3]
MHENPNPADKFEAVSLGQYVREHREQLGLTVRQLATRAGVSPAYVSRLENDQYHEPTPSTVRHLAEALELEPEDLYALSGYTVPHELPGYTAYLRAKFAMSDSAARELTRYFNQLAAKHNITERTHERSEKRKGSAGKPDNDS